MLKTHFFLLVDKNKHFAESLEEMQLALYWKRSEPIYKKRKVVVAVYFSFIMVGFTLISIVLFHNIFLLTSGIRIGKLSNQIYTPSPSSINSPTVFYYSNNCEECLCYGFQSTTTFVVVNCLTNIRLCLFYSSYATDYSFQWNSTSYVYFLELPPTITTTISSQITTDKTSTTEVTSEWWIRWNVLDER